MGPIGQFDDDQRCNADNKAEGAQEVKHGVHINCAYQQGDDLSISNTPLSPEVIKNNYCALEALAGSDLKAKGCL